MSEADDRSPVVLAVTISVLALSTVMVALRLIAKLRIVRQSTADDYLIVVAWIISVGLSTCIIYGTKLGLGHRSENRDANDAVPLRKMLFAFTILYNPALMATKTSILIFYLRLFRGTNEVLRIAAYVTMAVVNVAGLTLTFLNTFQCRPISLMFDLSRSTEVTCFGIVTLYLASAPVNIITDVAILLLPLPILTSLRLPRKQKQIVFFTFGVGVFVAVVDIIRLYYLQEASYHGTGYVTNGGQLNLNIDFAWFGSYSFMWTAIEVNVGIVCACVPSLKPLVKRIMPQLIYARRKSAGGGVRWQTGDSSPINSPRAPSSAEKSSRQMSSSNTPQNIPTLRDSEEGEIGMTEFLTSPLTISGNTLAAAPTAETENPTSNVATRGSEPGATPGFFDVVEPDNLLKVRGKLAVKYYLIVMTTFFIWGFSYGLINSLSAQIAAVGNIGKGEQLGILTIYFGGYLIGPITLGRWVIVRYGYKATFVSGLLVYSIGVIILWPSAVVISYPGFLISQFVVGFGLAVLETAANPFIVLCGNPRYAEARLLGAQAFQATASVVSNCIGVKVLFRASDPSLLDLQWAFLVIFFIMVIMSVFLYYTRIPEASCQDFEDLYQESKHEYDIPETFYKYRLRYLTLILACISMFFYDGSEATMSVSLNSFLATYTAQGLGVLKISDFSATLIAQAMFAMGRFTGAVLCFFFKPRIVMFGFFIGLFPLAALILALKASTNALTGITLLYWFFQGPIWPGVYAMVLRGQGSFTKTAGALLVMTASGHSAFTWIGYSIDVYYDDSPRLSAIVFLGVMGVAIVYPIFINCFPKPRRRQDLLTHPRRTGRERLDSGDTLNVHTEPQHMKAAANKTPHGESRRSVDGSV